MEMITVKAGSVGSVNYGGKSYVAKKDGTITMPLAALEWFESIGTPARRRGEPTGKIKFDRVEEDKKK